MDYAGFVYRGTDHAASIYEIHYGPWHDTTRKVILNQDILI